MGIELWLAVCGLGALLGAVVEGAVVVDYALDQSFSGTIAGRHVAAEPGPGATFVESAEGYGVAPGAEGCALRIPIPAGTWQSRGALAFWFRASRRIGKGDAELTIPLAQSAFINVSLVEPTHIRSYEISPHYPHLKIQLRTQDDVLPDGELELSHIKPNQWYHLIVAWNPDANRLDAYLNGIPQPSPLGKFRKKNIAWRPVAGASGDLVLGGVAGTGERKVAIAVDSVQLFDRYLSERDVEELLKGRAMPRLAGEGRTLHPDKPLDLAPYEISPVYEADFSKPLNVVHENALVEKGKRVRRPAGADWVLEGKGRVWTQDGKLHFDHRLSEGKGDNIVLWNTRVFPENFLLELGIAPEDSENGLAIIFLCATARAGGGIFDPGVAGRYASFRRYVAGDINCYHVSYWAGGRTSTNMRKNSGFHLVSSGMERITEAGAGPHRVRLLKVGDRIQLETCGFLTLEFDDDGETWGPVYGAGRIGLRQMRHAGSSSYSCFRVWEVRER
ncbi:MAG: DUF1961 family protein [Kiritimatiellae bacterium]|nr:DUF1961 family protein [Kiritimatiellia bacterium]